MTFFAPRIERIKHSPSNSSTQRVRELRAQGRDIIGLTLGELDFDTPDNIKRAAERAIARNETRYTAIDGTDALKEAVRAKFKRDNQLEYAKDQVTVGTGAKQLIYNAMMATLSVGDEVIIAAPYWVSYTDIVLLADGKPVTVACEEAGGFKLTAGQLEAAITPRTKWLILNSPANPTGATYSRSELLALAAVLVRHPQVWVLTDDIYEHLLFDGHPFATMAQVEPALYDRTFTVNGVSKAYAMTGWRIGYGGGPKRLISNIAKLMSQSTSNACSISQAAAREALTGPQEGVQMRSRELQLRRDIVVPMLNAAPGLHCSVPEGAFYVFPNCSALLGKTTPDGKKIETGQDFSVYMLDHGVAGIPGEAYGSSPYLRLSIASDLATLVEACGRIQHACQALLA